MKNRWILPVVILAACAFAACHSHVPYKNAVFAGQETAWEKHRPKLHFSPPSKWMNDPNGMVYHEGEYHLFYQYYPDSTVWGPMHWGHAVSRDLVHWMHLPIALYPDSLGYIFSGSAVADRNNTSGFGKNGRTPLVAIFTYHDMAGEKAGRSDFQSQGIAWSLDNGRTWTKYAGNPVIPNPGNVRDFRDPKVLWDAASGQWIMVFAVGDHVNFWGSKNLKNWQHLSDFGKDRGAHGGVWECPDLFPIQVEGSAERKWVLLVSINPGAPNGGSGTQYFVGNFDGKTFTPDPAFPSSAPAVWLDYGRDDYAGVTWSDVPEKDGRRLFLGWMSNWDYATVVPTDSWRSAMTVPRTLQLKKTAQGYRLFSLPVRELEKLRKEKTTLAGRDVFGNDDLGIPAAFAGNPMEFDLAFEPGAGSNPRFGIELYNKKGERYRVGYDAAAGQFFSDRTQAGDHAFSPKFAVKMHTAPRLSTDKTIRLHILVDVASAETFADGGATALTDIFFPTEPFGQARIFSENGTVRLTGGTVYRLENIWKWR